MNETKPGGKPIQKELDLSGPAIETGLPPNKESDLCVGIIRFREKLKEWAAKHPKPEPDDDY